MKNYQAKNVDDYIAGSAKESRAKLEELRKVIKSAVPKAEETISWGIPFYKYQGILAGFAVFKNHVSFGLSYALDSKLREDLAKKGYPTGSKTIQIRFDQKVPATAIKKMLKERAKINEAKRKMK